jgi:hypothetical protein
MKKIYNLLSISTLLIIIHGCCINKPDLDYSSGNTVIGPEFSYRSSSYWGEDTKDQDVKRVGGIGLGAFGHWILCSDYPQLGFYSGLLYFQNGARIDLSETTGEMLKNKLHYLTIPFSPTYEVYNGIRIEAGFDLSFLLAAKAEYEYLDQVEIQNIKDEVSTAQIGFNIGTSYSHEPTGLAGFLRYNGGLTTMPSNEYDAKVRNGSISIGIRYRVNHHMNTSKSTKPKRAPRYRNK